MANTWYPTAKQAMGAGNLELDAGTFKAVLVDTADYTYSATHDFLNDVPAGARVATATLSNVTWVGAVLDADDAVFSTVSGDQSEALIIYKDTGAEATSNLIVYIDTATGLPITPGGGNINVAWNASGIAAL